MKIKPLLLVSLATLLLAAILRFSNLNSLPIFADESIYVRWSQVMRAEPSLRFLPLSDGKQPLFMWLTIPFLKVISDPLLAARVLSGLTGLGSVLGVGLASYLVFNNRRLSLISSILWSVLPYSVFFERLALADALLSMFLIWAFNFMLLAVTKCRLDFSMLSGFALGFAYLTKSPALFFFFLLPLLTFLIDKQSISHSRLLKTLGLFIVSFVIALGMYNVLRLGPQFHQIALRNSDYIHPLSDVLTHPLDPLIPHLKDSVNFYFYLTTPVGFLFIVWGMFDPRRTHLKERLILGLFLLTPIISQSFLAKGFTARYLFFTLPFAVILMSHGLEHLGQRTKEHLLTYLGLGLIVTSSLWVDYLLLTDPSSVPLPRVERAGYLEDWTAGQGIKEISSYIIQAATLGPVLVGSEGFFGTPFSALELYLNQVPNVRITGVGVVVASVPERLISATVDNKVFLVVNSTRFHLDPQNTPGLKLISNYPKSVRPDNTREYLLFFEVLSQ